MAELSRGREGMRERIELAGKQSTTVRAAPDLPRPCLALPLANGLAGVQSTELGAMEV